MSVLPRDVAAVKRKLARNPEHELAEIAAKLINDADPDLVRMWSALERRRMNDDDSWVWLFLSAVAAAKSLPRYHRLPAKKRRKLSENIAKFADRLALELEANDLDAHIVHVDVAIIKGFYFYEDFAESRQAWIDSTGTSMLRMSRLIKEAAIRAQRMIAEDPIAGKNAQRADAIRFIRLLAASNTRLYDNPSPALIMPAVNALFSTVYAVSDISKMLKRLPRAK